MYSIKVQKIYRTKKLHLKIETNTINKLVYKFNKNKPSCWIYKCIWFYFAVQIETNYFIEIEWQKVEFEFEKI